MTETRTGHDAAAPEFTTAMRGYDRLQVDEYIARVDRWAEEARMRMEMAESQLAESRGENAELQKRLREARHAAPAPSEDLEKAAARVKEIVHQALGECDGM